MEPSPRPLPPVPRSPEDDHAPEAVERRRRAIEAATGIPLEAIAGAPADPREARGNCENLVGFARVPLGVAGPLCVDTSDGPLEVYVPMATTEGTLVASYSRGMRLLAEGGGARARVVREGLSQHPVLVYADAAHAEAAAEVVRRGFEEWRELVAGTTRHGALRSAGADVVGRRLVLSLDFTTGDALGINMAARAADLVSARIAERTGALERYVHGEDVEKRAHARGAVLGRGRSVVCDVRVPRETLERIARTTPEAMEACWRTYQVGFARLRTASWVVQAANGLAAVLLACGQDVAYLPESVAGQLDLAVQPDGALYASVTLPSLLVGTVGGGTHQGTAAECLRLLGCLGPGRANRFAEILAATVLAGDLSLVAAFCSHEFVAAHERLGRNRPPGGAEGEAGPG